MDKAKWRVMRTPPAEGAWNMAIDEGLMLHAAATGQCVMRVYAWARPTLSFGRNQVALGRYALDRIRDAGISTVRRPTGGRSVLHFREVTYAVAAPEELGSLNNAYQRINAILVAALAELGVHVTTAASGRHALSLGPAPCFDTPSRGELVLGDRKIVGSAQWRDNGVLLQHGSILVHDDQEQIPRLLISAGAAQSDSRVGARATTPHDTSPPATLSEALGREPTFAEIADAIVAAVRELEDSQFTAIGPEELDATILNESLEKYRSDSWTWRR